jgi:hypothetical protein
MPKELAKKPIQRAEKVPEYKEVRSSPMKPQKLKEDIK